MYVVLYGVGVCCCVCCCICYRRILFRMLYCTLLAYDISIRKQTVNLYSLRVSSSNNEQGILLILVSIAAFFPLAVLVVLHRSIIVVSVSFSISYSYVDTERAGGI